MTRHDTDENTLDPREAAELEALEAALAGSSADPEWTALVAAVRDEPPVAGDRAREALDARVAAGFPRETRRPAWLRLPSRGRLLPALAVASTLVIGGVVVSAGGLDGGASDSSVAQAPTSASPSGAAAGEAQEDSTEALPGAIPRPAPEEGPASGRAASPVPPDPSSSKKADAVPTRERSVERTATLELTTAAGRLQEAADRIVRATQDLGGVVGSSRVDGGPTGGNADFELRIPSARLDDALKRFGEIANVSRLSQGAEDITDAVVSSEDRLADARSERKALLRALGKAEKEQAITSLRSRIAINRGQIAQLEADLRSLERRSDLATVQVTLQARGEPSATDEDDGGAWGPGAAADTALRVLEVAAGVLLVGAAALVPALLLLAGLVLGGRGLRRRRREAALGAA